jgi:hypothetical protein
MRKIKNDPTSYVKRSGLVLKPKGGEQEKHVDVAVRRKSTFLTAPIDRAGYIDFSAPPLTRRR